MIELKEGFVYDSSLYGKAVIYLGLKQYESTNEYYHQFEYLEHEPFCSGYGQNDEQVLTSGYTYNKTLTVLHGRPS